MFRCNHHHQGAHYLSLLASPNNALPDDGDCTETCRSGFNVNFYILFKVILLCVSW